MAQQTSKTGMGVGTVLGFLAGVGVGLLFATRTGEETREKLAGMFHGWRERGEELGREAEEKLETAKETMTSEGGKEPFYESGKYT